MKVLREKMEITCNEFLNATKEYIAASFKSKIEGELMSNPDIAKNHGIEGLSHG